MRFESAAFAAILVFTPAACVSQPELAPANPPVRGPMSTAPATITFKPAGPQSYTPEVNPKGRDRAVRQLWSTTIGRTDHRTTLAFADGAVWVGAKRGTGMEPGVYVIDGKTGERRARLPAASGEVIGIALDGDRVYSSSASGEVAASTKAGKIVFRTNVGAPVVTAPTLLDANGDGTIDVVVGDANGRITLLDGKSGKAAWVRAMGAASESARSIGSGLAAADLDGDGAVEIVGGSEGGVLFALRARNGEVAWQLSHASALRAAPLLSDVNADKKLEVIAGWADGDVAIVDGRTGKEIWSAHVEEDDGDPTGLLASPTPMPGGGILVPTARWGKDDSVVLLGAHDRAYRSKQGSVVASPVLGTIQLGAPSPEAVVGTRSGDVVSFDATGSTSLVYRLDGAIEAAALIADLEGNGLQEIVVATRDGRLVALAIHSTTPPLLGQARGGLHNDAVLPPIDLGWRLP